MENIFGRPKSDPLRVEEIKKYLAEKNVSPFKFFLMVEPLPGPMYHIVDDVISNTKLSFESLFEAYEKFSTTSRKTELIHRIEVALIKRVDCPDDIAKKLAEKTFNLKEVEHTQQIES